MLSFNLDPAWFLNRLGLDLDPETTELVAQLALRYRNAPNRELFVKEALRRALMENGPAPRSGQRRG